MVTAQPINFNVSCKLHPYSLQRTQLPPGPRLPKRIKNMHPRNYYDPKGKDIIVYFSFLNRGIILWVQSSRTGSRPSEGLVSYPGHSLVQWYLTPLQKCSWHILQPYPTGWAELQSYTSGMQNLWRQIFGQYNS